MRSHIEDTFKRAVSAATLFFFLTTNSAWSLPVSGISIAPSGETPGFLQIEIPPDLASIEEVYEAPPKADPRLILHIQNLHGNESAQSQTKKLLTYLYEKYGFKMLFVEGAVSDLDPDYLRLFPDKERNVKLAEALVKQGELTGVEYYLMDGPEDVRAVGIEKADLYRANYEAFKKVYGAKSDTDRFLAEFDGKLQMLATHIFPQETRRILSEWKKFEAGHRDFLPFVKRLAQDSKRVLGLDLESLFAQVEWPQITRLLVIQGMEKDMNESAAMAERTRLVEFLKSRQVSPEITAAIEKLGERKITVSKKDDPREKLENLPRYLFERMVEEAGPKGFYFHDYPAFSLWAGHLILQNELDSKQLFDEIHRVFEKVLVELAASEPQKNLLELYQDGELLRKLYALEVSRKEWERILYRREWIEPKSMLTRLEKIGKGGADVISNEQLSGVFTTALDFYEFARKREDVFHETIEREMNGANAGKAVLVTGGFHTDGIMEKLRESEINYSVLMPRITGALDNSGYVSAMLENGQTMFDLATLEAVVKQQDGSSVVHQGASIGAESRRIVNQFILRVQSSVLDGVVDLEKLRSDLQYLQQTSYISSRGVGVNIAQPQANQQSVRFAFQPVSGKPAAYDVTFYTTNGKIAAQTKISADQTPPPPPERAVPAAVVSPVSPVSAPFVRSELRNDATDIFAVRELVEQSSLGADDYRDQILDFLQKAVDLASKEGSSKAAIAREIVEAEQLFGRQTKHLPSIDNARAALTRLARKWKKELPEGAPAKPGRKTAASPQEKPAAAEDMYWFTYTHEGNATTFGQQFIEMLKAARAAGFVTQLARATPSVLLVIKGAEGDRSIDRFENESDNVRVEPGDVFRIKFKNPRRSETRAMMLPEDVNPAAADAPTLGGLAGKISTIESLNDLQTIKEAGLKQVALLNRLSAALPENSRDRWVALKMAEQIENPAGFIETVQKSAGRTDDIRAMKGSEVLRLLETKGILAPRSEFRSTEEQRLQSLYDSLRMRHQNLQTARQIDANASVEDPLTGQRVSGAEGVGYLSGEIQKVQDQLAQLRSETRMDLTKAGLENALRDILESGYTDLHQSPQTDVAEDAENPEKVTIQFDHAVSERTPEKREKMRSQLARLGVELTSVNFPAYFFRVDLPRFWEKDYKLAIDDKMPYQLILEKRAGVSVAFSINDRTLQLPEKSTFGQLFIRLGFDRTGIGQKEITITAERDRQGKQLNQPIQYAFAAAPSTTKENSLSLFSVIQEGDKISMKDKKARSETRATINWDDFKQKSAAGEFGRIIKPGSDPSIPLQKLREIPEGLQVNLGTKEDFLIFSLNEQGDLQVRDSTGAVNTVKKGIVAGRSARQAKMTDFPEIQDENELKRIDIPGKKTSRSHLFAWNDGQNLILRDLNSANGSFVVLFPVVSLGKVLENSTGNFLAKLLPKQKVEFTTDDFFSLAEQDRPKLVTGPHGKLYQQQLKRLKADVLLNGVLFYLGSENVFITLGRIGGGQLQLQEWKVLADGNLEMGTTLNVARNDLQFIGSSPKVDPAVRGEFNKATLLASPLSKAAGMADTHAAIFWDGEKLSYIDLSQTGTLLHRKQMELLQGIRTITDTTDKISSGSISMVSQDTDVVLMSSRFKLSANDAGTTSISIPDVLEFQIGKRQMRLISVSNPVVTQKAAIAFQVEARGAQEGETVQPYKNIGNLEIDIERQSEGSAIALPGGLRAEIQDIGYIGLDDRIKAWYTASVAGKPFSEQNQNLRRLTIGDEARAMIKTLTGIVEKLAAGGAPAAESKKEAETYISKLDAALKDQGRGLEALLGSIDSVFFVNLGRNEAAAAILFAPQKIGPITLTPLQKEMKITGIQIRYGKINEKADTPKKLADVLSLVLGAKNINALPVGFSVTADEAAKKVIIPNAGRFAEIDYRDFDALVQVLQNIAGARSEMRKIRDYDDSGENIEDVTAIQSKDFAEALLKLNFTEGSDDVEIIYEIQGLLEGFPELLRNVSPIQLLPSILSPAEEGIRMRRLRMRIQKLDPQSVRINQVLSKALVGTDNSAFFGRVLKEMVRIHPDTGLPVNLDFVNALRRLSTEGEVAPFELDGTTLRYRSESRAAFKSFDASALYMMISKAFPEFGEKRQLAFQDVDEWLKEKSVLNIGLETQPLSDVIAEDNLVSDLRSKGITAVGVSPQVRINESREYYIRGTIQNIPQNLKKNSFDVIAVLGVLNSEYMGEAQIARQGFGSRELFYEQAISEMSAALKADGYIFVDIGVLSNSVLIDAFLKAGFEAYRLSKIGGTYLFTKGLTVRRMGEILDSVFVQPNVSEEAAAKYKAQKESLARAFLLAAEKGFLDAKKVNSILLQPPAISLKAGQAKTIARLINQAIETQASRSELRASEELVPVTQSIALDPAEAEALSEVEAQYRSELRSINSRQLFERAAKFEEESKAEPHTLVHAQKVLQMAMAVLKTLASNRSELTPDQFDFLQISQAADRMVLASRFHSIEEMQAAQHVSVDTILESLGFSPNERNIILQHYDELDEKDALLAKILAGAETAARLFEQGKPAAEIVNSLQTSSVDKRVVSALAQWIETSQTVQPVIVRPSQKDTDRLSRYTEGLPERAQQATFIGVDSPDMRMPQDLWVIGVLARGFAPFDPEALDEAGIAKTVDLLRRLAVAVTQNPQDRIFEEAARQHALAAASNAAGAVVLVTGKAPTQETLEAVEGLLIANPKQYFRIAMPQNAVSAVDMFQLRILEQSITAKVGPRFEIVELKKMSGRLLTEQISPRAILNLMQREGDMAANIKEDDFREDNFVQWIDHSASVYLDLEAVKDPYDTTTTLDSNLLEDVRNLGGRENAASLETAAFTLGATIAVKASQRLLNADEIKQKTADALNFNGKRIEYRFTLNLISYVQGLMQTLKLIRTSA